MGAKTSSPTVVYKKTSGSIVVNRNGVDTLLGVVWGVSFPSPGVAFPSFGLNQIVSGTMGKTSDGNWIVEAKVNGPEGVNWGIVDGGIERGCLVIFGLRMI